MLSLAHGSLFLICYGTSFSPIQMDLFSVRLRAHGGQCTLTFSQEECDVPHVKSLLEFTISNAYFLVCMILHLQLSNADVRVHPETGMVRSELRNTLQMVRLLFSNHALEWVLGWVLYHLYQNFQNLTHASSLSASMYWHGYAKSPRSLAFR